MPLSPIGAVGSALGSTSNRLFEENYNKLKNSALSKIGLDGLVRSIPTDTTEYQHHLNVIGVDGNPLNALKDNLKTQALNVVSSALTSLESTARSTVQNVLSFNIGKFSSDKKRTHEKRKISYQDFYKKNSINELQKTFDFNTINDFYNFYSQHDIFDNNKFFIEFDMNALSMANIINYTGLSELDANIDIVNLLKRNTSETLKKHKYVSNIIQSLQLPSMLKFNSFHDNGSNETIKTTNGNANIIGDRLTTDTQFSMSFIDLDDFPIIETVFIPWLQHINSEYWMTYDEPFIKANIEIIFPNVYISQEIVSYSLINVYPVEVEVRNKMERKTDSNISTRQVKFNFENMIIRNYSYDYTDNNKFSSTGEVTSESIFQTF